MFLTNEQIEKLNKNREKYFKKYFSEENIEKRKEKQKQYFQKAKEKYKEYSLEFSEKKKLLHEKDLEFYKNIWNTRKHYCENCNAFLGKNFEDKDGRVLLYRYAHIISKSIYPYLRHFEGNILLLCLNCHSKLDNSPKSIIQQMKCYDQNKIDYLKSLHKKLKEEKDETYK